MKPPAQMPHRLPIRSLLWSVDVPAREVVSSLCTNTGRIFLAGGCAEGVVAAVDMELSETPGAPNILWQQDAPSIISSPVATEQFLFTLSEAADLTCRRASDGRVLWSEIISQDPCYASLILAGTKLYAVDLAGTISLYKAAAGFKKLGEFNLNEAVYATPALAGKNLFVRSETHLYCLR